MNTDEQEVDEGGVCKQEFTRSKFHHKILKREGMICLVERTHVDHPFTHYEVVQLRRLPERQVFGKTLPSQEAYPSPEAWGAYGFTYSTRPEAERRFANW